MLKIRQTKTDFLSEYGGIMAHYYPIAFYKQYPMAPAILNTYRECTNNQPITFCNEEISDEGYWTKLYKLALSGCDRTGIDTSLLFVTTFNQVNNWIVWGAWQLGGAMIFSLQPELVQEFLETDVTGLKIRDINVPAEQLYLHWGVNESLGNIDGCFILKVNDDIYFCPTSYDPNVDYEKPVNWFHEPQTPVDCKLAGHWDIDYDFLYREMEEKTKDFSAGPFPAVMDSDTAFIVSGFMGEAYRKFQPYLLPLLRLIVTAMLYLTSAPDDVTPVWEDAPEELVKKWENAPPAKRKRITQELNKLGYRRIWFVGRKLTYPDAPTRPPRQLTDTSHLVFSRRRRRGHIRHQACGEGRQQRKIVFIRPTWTWVRVSEANADMTLPRVYDVAPQTLLSDGKIG
jgi:hypothetical protein